MQISLIFGSDSDGSVKLIFDDLGMDAVKRASDKTLGAKFKFWIKYLTVKSGKDITSKLPFSRNARTQ